MNRKIALSLRKEAVMKVQCPKCKVGYKIDEKKLPAKGTYVRCRKCQHKFFIKKEEPAETAVKTIECPRCKLPQRGINKCEYCGLVFEEKSKTKKNSRSKNLKKDSLTNCRFCKAQISGNAETCPHCGKPQIIKIKKIVWLGIVAFIILFSLVIPYFTEQTTHRPKNLTEQDKDRPKTEIKPSPKKVVSKSLSPEMKARIQKYVDDWIKTKRFIQSGFMDGSSNPHVFFELDVRYLGNNPEMQAKQFSDNVALQATRIFRRGFCIHTYYGDHNKLSMSCEIFRN